MDPGPFLLSVLGRDGYKALRKAVVQDSELEKLLFPRAVLAWVGLAARVGHQGFIPGTDIAFNLAKSDNGLNGNVGVDPVVNESIYRVAARVYSAMGFAPADSESKIKAHDAQRLGKSVDLLVKSVGVKLLQKKLLDPNLGYTFKHTHQEIDVLGDKTKRTIVHAFSPSGEKVGEADFLHGDDGTMESIGTEVHQNHRRQGLASAMYAHAEKTTGIKVAPSTARTPEGQALWAGNAGTKQFGKAEGPAATAGPTPPGGPEAPAVAPTRVKARIPKRTVGAVSLSKSCKTCERPMFRGGRLACPCWKHKSGDTRLNKSETGYELVLGSTWDDASAAALVVALAD